MSFFEGFDLGDVVRVEVESFTVGAGGHAQITSVTFAVYREQADDPELMEVVFADAGPAAGTLQALVKRLNEKLSQRRDGRGQDG